MVRNRSRLKPVVVKARAAGIEESLLTRISSKPQSSRGATGDYDDGQLIDYRKAADFLCVSVAYLKQLKAEGKVSWVPIGGRGVRFRVGSLRAWVEKKEIK